MKFLLGKFLEKKKKWKLLHLGSFEKSIDKSRLAWKE